MFDPRTQQTYSHESYDAMNSSAKTRKKAQNKYSNFNGGGIQFRPEKILEDDDSGVSSPPLWRRSPPTSPIHSQQSQNNFRHLSPTSRVQAIARGQLELMEMVKAMPESSYELSLKDLVEHHKVGKENQESQEECQESQEECLVEEKSKLSKKASVKRQGSVKKVEKKAKMVRSGSNINENKGLFLKMVFPIKFGGKKKKAANPYAKVPPKTDANTDNNKCLQVGEKEWWKKRISSISDESESGGLSSASGRTGSSSSSSGSSGSRKSNRSNSIRKKRGCLSGFSPFHPKKDKSTK